MSVCIHFLFEVHNITKIVRFLRKFLWDGRWRKEKKTNRHRILTVICLSAQVWHKQIAQRLVQGLEQAYQLNSSAVLPYVMQGHFSNDVPIDFFKLIRLLNNGFQGHKFLHVFQMLVATQSPIVKFCCFELFCLRIFEPKSILKL